MGVVNQKDKMVVSIKMNIMRVYLLHRMLTPFLSSETAMCVNDFTG